MKHLAALLDPIDLRQFLEQTWRRQVAVSRGTAERAERWMTPAGFCEAVLRARFADALINIVRDGIERTELRRSFEHAREAWGERPSMDAVCAAAGECATFVFNSLDLRHRGVRDLCTGLMRETGRVAAANAYLSPTGATSGLCAHFDIQEIFILQVAGTKRWTVAPPLRSEPLQQPDLAQRHAYEFPSDVMAFDLTPGDVLYVPRGAWHEPVTLEGPSLHLTITLPHWTPLDVLRWMGSRLEREAPMRREFALHPEQGRTDEAVQQQLTEALNQIAELASDEDAVRRYVLDTFTHHASRYSEDQDVPVVEER